jgi:S1-C subfamily serine protease
MLATAGKRFWQKLVICLLIVLTSLGLGGFGEMTRAVAAPFRQADPESNFVMAAVDKAESAVVQVNVSRSVGGNVPDFLRPFLGGGPVPPSGPMLQGLGSGFIIDKSGQVLTNAHVVNEADTVTVTMQDGRVLEGKVLGTDSVTDIAVIQVEAAEDLPTVTLGDSDKVRQGQWAIAIGNPLGLQETVTVGVISGIERSSTAIGVPDKRINFLQTDAAINPGNSGGPLLSSRGDAIGVNTAVIGGAQGLGFAIPINTAREVVQQLLTVGRVEHPYIGVQMVTLNPQIKQQLNKIPGNRLQLESDRGVFVAQIQRNSPAAKAGLRAGDVIQQIDTQSVTDAKQVQQLINKAGVGGELSITVQRRERTVDLTIQPEQLPSPRGE